MTASGANIPAEAMSQGSALRMILSGSTPSQCPKPTPIGSLTIPGSITFGTTPAPAVNGAIVLSVRGGDFELTIGRDLSIGYHGHTETTVRLYLVESLAFRVLTPEAAVALTHADKPAKR